MSDIIISAPDVTPIREITQHTLNSEVRTDGVGHQQAAHLIRRLRVALLDLGLERTIPNGWVGASTDGLNFTSLTLRQANRLVRALEDLAVDHVAEVPEPGPGQLSLFEDVQ